MAASFPPGDTFTVSARGGAASEPGPASPASGAAVLLPPHAASTKASMEHAPHIHVVV
jgi:hypothetical protein